MWKSLIESASRRMHAEYKWGEIKWRYDRRISGPDLASKDGIQPLGGVNPIPKHVRIWILTNKRFVIFNSHYLCLPFCTTHLRVKFTCTTTGRPRLPKSCTRYQTIFFIQYSSSSQTIYQTKQIRMAAYVP